MMTKKFRLFLCLTVVVFSISIMPVSAAQTQTNWVIAAQQFDFTRNQTGSVADGISSMFPMRILEKLSSNLYRTVQIDETAQRELYNIRMDRNSLFLQLSAGVKTRDSLVLGNYSKRELDLKLEKENAKIKEIKDKLAQNLVRQKELDSLLMEEQSDDSKNEAKNSKKTFFSTQNTDSVEKIVLYRGDISTLFKPSANTDFQKQVVDAKINCLISGKITAFDEYISVTVTAKTYPGEKEIAVITEIGSIDDADLIASAIANELAPAITNSMPCVLRITTDTLEALDSLCVYVDDILYNDINTEITVDAGVHFIQFTAEGFKNAGTNYYFQGNKNYSIQVSLEKVQSNTVYLKSKSVLQGDFIANGLPSVKLEDNASKISVNGNDVLAQFVTQDKTSFFMYIPENKLYEGALYTAKAKPVNHNDYIEKRRRQMYLSYSVLVTSLIPTIISHGIVESYKPMLTNETTKLGIQNLDDKVNTANAYVLASNICSGISIACGIWFVFELYRYFSAANSVLPASTKIDFSYVPANPVTVTEEPAATEEAVEATNENSEPQITN